MYMVDKYIIIPITTLYLEYWIRNVFELIFRSRMIEVITISRIYVII